MAERFLMPPSDAEVAAFYRALPLLGWSRASLSFAVFEKYYRDGFTPHIQSPDSIDCLLGVWLGGRITLDDPLLSHLEAELGRPIEELLFAPNPDAADGSEPLA